MQGALAVQACVAARTGMGPAATSAELAAGAFGLMLRLEKEKFFDGVHCGNWLAQGHGCPNAAECT
eukprot:scaffold168674_cov19-Tisochrysis_lutea.AAC.1